MRFIDDISNPVYARAIFVRNRSYNSIFRSSFLRCLLFARRETRSRTRGTIGSISPLSIPLAISSERVEKWEPGLRVKKLPHLTICFRT